MVLELSLWSLVMNLSKYTIPPILYHTSESKIVLPKEMSCSQSCPAVTNFKSICCEEHCKLLCLAYLSLASRLTRSSNSELKHPAKLGTDFGPLPAPEAKTRTCEWHSAMQIPPLMLATHTQLKWNLCVLHAPRTCANGEKNTAFASTNISMYLTSSWENRTWKRRNCGWKKNVEQKMDRWIFFVRTNNIALCFNL